MLMTTAVDLVQRFKILVLTRIIILFSNQEHSALRIIIKYMLKIDPKMYKEEQLFHMRINHIF
jgi:hypothetical protein